MTKKPKMPISHVENIDCMEFMKTLPDKAMDLAIVDPPYGIDIARWDAIDMKPSEDYFKELFRVSTKQIIWGANYFHLPHSESWICWDKTLKSGTTALGGNFKSEFELAWTNFEDRKAKMFHYTYDGNIQGLNGGKVDWTFKSIHPTQKPVVLYKWLLKNYAKEGDKILDTHGGSMSSVIAALDMGFEIHCCELDAEYYLAAKKRIESFLAQTNAFQETPEIIFK